MRPWPPILSHPLAASTNACSALHGHPIYKRSPSRLQPRSVSLLFRRDSSGCCHLSPYATLSPTAPLPILPYQSRAYARNTPHSACHICDHHGECFSPLSGAADSGESSTAVVWRSPSRLDSMYVVLSGTLAGRLCLRPYTRDLSPFASAGLGACSPAPGFAVRFATPASGTRAITGGRRSHLASHHSPMHNDWRALFLAGIHGATAAGVVHAWSTRGIAILVVCSIERQCLPRPGDLSHSGRTCTIAAHAGHRMECGIRRVCALGRILGMVCDAHCSRCGPPSYAWSERTSAQPRCVWPLVRLAVYGIGLTAGGDQYLVPGHGGHPFPVDRTSQSVSPDLYSLFC